MGPSTMMERARGRYLDSRTLLDGRIYLDARIWKDPWIELELQTRRVQWREKELAITLDRMKWLGQENVKEMEMEHPMESVWEPTRVLDPMRWMVLMKPMAVEMVVRKEKVEWNQTEKQFAKASPMGTTKDEVTVQ